MKWREDITVTQFFYQHRKCRETPFLFNIDRVRRWRCLAFTADAVHWMQASQNGGVAKEDSTTFSKINTDW